MSKSLYLLETRARYIYDCSGCGAVINRGSAHFRHDPHPYARMYRGELTTHWCYACVAAVGIEKEKVTGRIRVPVVRVLSNQVPTKNSIALARVEIIGVGRQLAEILASEPSHIHQLNPAQFEELICDRLYEMGFEPKKVGNTYRKDGGIDILFWPREKQAIPILGAAQVKHHRKVSTKEGVNSVRDLAGTIAGQPINVGLLITNTSFTPDAHWFARERAKLLRLRDYIDIKRWLQGNFDDQAEWRELPDSIEVCPGIVVPLRKP